MIAASIKHDEFGRGKNMMIVDTCRFKNGMYETICMKSDGTEMEIRRMAIEQDAIAAHNDMLHRWKDNYVGEFSDRMNRLANALNQAVEAARPLGYTEDGGSCNFDGMALLLPHWQEKHVDACAAKAGLVCFDWTLWRTKRWVFTVPVPRQGNARTRQAEKMCEVMRELGYDAEMYYQMD